MRACPDVRMASAQLRCLGESPESRSIPVMPMTPCIGVRISSLIVARKALLDWLAISAASLACIRLAVRLMVSVRSRQRASVALLPSKTTGVIVNSTVRLDPSARRRSHSNLCEPQEIATRFISRSFSADLRPSGCISEERSGREAVSRSCLAKAPIMVTAA